MTDNARQLEATMAALQAQRALLGDAVVDAALAALREKLAALTQPEQQLKAVTVLFLDVVGSTALSQTIDPEDLLDIMDSALQSFSARVAERGGKVLNYAGDSVLAALGCCCHLVGQLLRAASCHDPTIRRRGAASSAVARCWARFRGSGVGDWPCASLVR